MRIRKPWRRKMPAFSRTPQTARIVSPEHKKRLEEINKFARETTWYFEKPVPLKGREEGEIPKGVDPLQVHLDEFADDPGLFLAFMEQAIESEPHGGLVPYDFVDSFRKKLHHVQYSHSAHLRRPCERLVPHLANLLEHGHPNVRMQAAGYLREIAPVAEGALPKVENRIKTENEPRVLRQLEKARAAITGKPFERAKTKPPE